ncbi:MAG: 50S ribosomal protein L6 [Chloroflexi bacterium]|nr:50S ribosomal protein L6 [Chloroflexota bacterium]
MSRIGRMPIPLPAGVKVKQEGTTITIQGPRGSLTRDFRPEMTITLEGNTLKVSRPDDNRQNRALHGLTRALLANMVEGVTVGFRKQLVVNGVGYRATQQGKNLELQVGFSHPVIVEPPEGIKLEVDRAGRVITVEGNDKELVGEVAAKIRAIRKPEPYKGKGIAYEGEVIRRKAGKAGRVGG